jgi:hypothetical protein
LELQKERGNETYKYPDGGTIDLSPINFFRKVVVLPKSPVQQDLPKVLSRDQPPSLEEWKQLRVDMNEFVAPRGRVSMVFNSATAWDVIATISLQANTRFFLEPIDLNRRLENEIVTMRLENVPWDDALTAVLKQLKPPLQFKMEGEGKGRYGIISHAKE